MNVMYQGINSKHKSEDYNPWAEHKVKGRNPKDSASTESKLSSSNVDKLGISDDLKEAMVINFQCTKNEADKIWSDIVKNGSSLN